MMVLHLCLSICNMIAVMNIRLWTFFVLDNSYVPLKIIYLLYLQPIITQYFIDNKSEIWLLFLIAHSKR